MKVIAIPDTHGFNHWKKSIPLINSVDKIVFLGDYMDEWVLSFQVQFKNLKEIINFKKENMKKVELLWGNHDTSYYLGNKCSGFQEIHHIDIKELYQKNKNLFNVVFIADNWIFSHAGVSGVWMTDNKIKDVKDINQIFMEKPKCFFWTGPDSYGNNINEGPLWIRPEALCKSALSGYNYVCGHTEMSNNGPTELNIHNGDNKVILIDNSKHDQVICIDTVTGEYSLI